MSETIYCDTVWRAKGDSAQRLRIADRRRDGRVVVERIAGAPEHALRREVTVTEQQLRSAFEPTGEFDFGD